MQLLLIQILKMTWINRFCMSVSFDFCASANRLTHVRRRNLLSCRDHCHVLSFQSLSFHALSQFYLRVLYNWFILCCCAYVSSLSHSILFELRVFCLNIIDHWAWNYWRGVHVAVIERFILIHTLMYVFLNIDAINLIWAFIYVLYMWMLFAEFWLIVAQQFFFYFSAHYRRSVYDCVIKYLNFN